MQKERFRSSECMFSLVQEQPATRLHQVREAESLAGYVERLFDEIEGRFGLKGWSRLATYITCAEYGLTETELLELLMPIHNSEAMIETTDGSFNFSSFRCLLNHIGEIFYLLLCSAFCLVLDFPRGANSFSSFKLSSRCKTKYKTLFGRRNIS